MCEIEKVGDLKSQNISIKNHLINASIKKSHIGLVKISLVAMKKFQLKKLIQYETFFQQPVFKMSRFDFVIAKKSHLRSI